MIANYSRYAVPALGACCVAGAISVGVALRAPKAMEIAAAAVAPVEAPVPKNLVLAGDIPTMEQVVEKHLFVKERKATGANTFPDLLVKGVYVGSKCSVVLSLKSKPVANLRVWQGEVNTVVGQITDPRDPRKPIVDFLNEWDIKEISFKGLTVENFITGEVETYAVDYTPAKHVKDSALAGYGQGMPAETAEGGGGRNDKPAQASPAKAQQQAQGLMMTQLRDMMQTMTPEQRARLAQRITESGGSGGVPGGGRDSVGGARPGASEQSAPSKNSQSKDAKKSSKSSKSGR